MAWVASRATMGQLDSSEPTVDKCTAASISSSATSSSSVPFRPCRQVSDEQLTWEGLPMVRDVSVESECKQAEKECSRDCKRDIGSAATTEDSIGTASSVVGVFRNKVEQEMRRAARHIINEHVRLLQYFEAEGDSAITKRCTVHDAVPKPVGPSSWKSSPLASIGNWSTVASISPHQQAGTPTPMLTSSLQTAVVRETATPGALHRAAVAAAAAADNVTPSMTSLAFFEGNMSTSNPLAAPRYDEGADSEDGDSAGRGAESEALPPAQSTIRTHAPMPNTLHSPRQSCRSCAPFNQAISPISRSSLASINSFQSFAARLSSHSRHTRGEVDRLLGRDSTSPTPLSARSPEPSLSFQSEAFKNRVEKKLEKHLKGTNAKNASNAASQEKLETNFTAWEIWENTGPTQQSQFASRFQSERVLSIFLDEDEEDAGAEEPDEDAETKGCINCFLRRLMLKPTSFKRMTWDMMALLFVIYESFAIPFDFFNPPETTFSFVMVWAVRMFWTADLPLSFFTGYLLPDATVEMRLRLVASNYLRTWCAIDISMLAIDWIEAAMGGVAGVNAARMGKTIKGLRMIRVARLFRLLRVNGMPDFIKAFVYSINSELVVIIAGICKLFFFMIWVNHTIACIWYGIGDANAAGGGHGSWVTSSGVLHQPLEYKYFTSFHWSLSQFAGTMEVTPSNAGERAFAVVILLFAFFVAASVVSRITSSMTRLEIVTAQRSEQLYKLQQYLTDNHISSKLSLKVQRNAQRALDEQKKNTPEAEIELLGIISDYLKLELHFTMNMPLLSCHPLLDIMAKAYSAVMQKVCHSAINRVSLVKADLLFTYGEVEDDPHCFFVMSGSLSYRRRSDGDGSGPRMEVVGGKQWLAEAALWAPWMHVGVARAKADTMVMALSAHRFQLICTTELSNSWDCPIRKYGRNYIKSLNELKEIELSDLRTDAIDIEKMTYESFPGYRPNDPKGKATAKEDKKTLALPRRQNASTWSGFDEGDEDDEIMNETISHTRSKETMFKEPSNASSLSGITTKKIVHLGSDATLKMRSQLDGQMPGQRHSTVQSDGRMPVHSTQSSTFEHSSRSKSFLTDSNALTSVTSLA